MLWISLIPMLMGGKIAAQSAINTKLKNEVGSPFLASTISFFVGTIFLSVLLAFMRPTISLSATLIVNNPWWVWIGGFTSAFALTANVLLFTHLGSVQTSVLPIVGQIIMSVIIDQFGLFQSPQTSLNPVKIIGLLILLLGALFSANIGIKRSPLEHTEKGPLITGLGN
ncbi:DMT family transporter [Lactiplantibacillus herbarum]|uniref:DMT family transporter n=1 Tax=Lactiplantibacillus herbarum TaxID=1670446 RepID=UPI0009E21506|nr:DMT family transporter [Lactiplantibacillus herbarum]